MLLNLLSMWKNRETKAKLREENKQLRKELSALYKSHVPIFDKSLRITSNRWYYIKHLFSDVSDNEITEMLAQDFVPIIKEHMIIETEFDMHSGNTTYIATLYIADYEDEKKNVTE